MDGLNTVTLSEGVFGCGLCGGEIHAFAPDPRCQDAELEALCPVLRMVNMSLQGQPVEISEPSDD